MDSFIDIRQYTYTLPVDKIALYPLPRRDQSRLLVYRNGSIEHRTFDNLEEFIPENSTLVLNDTRVIPARLLFRKDTGAEIEIFLLTPVFPSTEVQHTMTASGPVQWRCAIGNLKKWNEGLILVAENAAGILKARLIDGQSIVEFIASPARPFAEVVQHFGETPLPPYIKRKAEGVDRERYQTVYSENSGAVAAPTAGLHFTPEIIDKLRNRGVKTVSLTLHVSAGTFVPVKVQNAVEHNMHTEQVVIPRDTLKALLSSAGPVFAVGTTSLRTLESLYWYGLKLLANPDAAFKIDRLEPYLNRTNWPSWEDALHAVAGRMDQEKLTMLTGETSIYILPGYKFRVVDGLVTNFHQPQSTLLLLVAAFIGSDWKKVYGEALENNYRFLSYGDSSILIPSPQT